TGAALLPGGDVLVVERRYPPLAARIRRITAEALERGELEGTEIARLAAPLNVDNFEGIEVLRGPRGETRVLLVTDDNDCIKRGGIRTGLQRTLVMLFDLAGLRVRERSSPGSLRGSASGSPRAGPAPGTRGGSPPC